MLEFYISGGFPMHIISLLGLLCIGSAIFFVRSPSTDAVPRIISMSVALAVTAFAGILAALTMTFRFAASNEKMTDSELLRIVLQGISESLSPGIWGGTMLVVTYMLMALGFRRLSLLRQ